MAKTGYFYVKDASGAVSQVVPAQAEYAGATATSAGVAGLVPGALSAEKDMFLKGDGTWSGVAAELSLDARCEDVVTPATRTAFPASCSMSIEVAGGGGEDEIASGSTDGVASFIVLEITDSYVDTGAVSFYLGMCVSANCDGRNYYALENTLLSDLIDAGSDGMQLTLTSSSTSSGIDPDTPIFLSCVSNGNDSYTFNIMTGTEATTGTELTLDLVSGENRTDLKPLIGYIGGKAEMTADKPMLCLEPSCDPCIDLSPVMDAVAVHKTGNEEISGIKTFTSEIRQQRAPLGTVLRCQNTSLTKGTPPDKQQNAIIDLVADKDYNRLSTIESIIRTNGDTLTRLYAFHNDANASDSANMEIYCYADGIAQAHAPRTMADDNAHASDNDVVTRSFFNNNAVHKTGNEEISGIKTFTSETIHNANIKITRTATISGQSVTHEAGLSMNSSSLNFGLYDWTNSKWLIFCTPSGEVRVSDTLTAEKNVFAMRDTTTNELSLYGGSTATNGAGLYLYGGDGNFNGQFRVRAAKGSTYRDLIGNYNGNLTWNGNNVITDGGDQTVSGIKTFTNNPQIAHSTTAIFLDMKSTTSIRGTAGSNNISYGLAFYDKNKAKLGQLSYWYTTTKDSYVQIRAYNATSSTASDHADFYVGYGATSGRHVRPDGNGVTDLGLANYRWNRVYAANGTIQTSDERLKSAITDVPDAVLDAWNDVQWLQFQFNDAVAKKGVDKARLHNGLVAQRIDAVFKAHGLDASRYGLFCYDAWDATQEQKDENGVVLNEASPAGEQYSLRYEEALAMEAAYQRREAARAKARVDELEARLAALEAKMA